MEYFEQFRPKSNLHIGLSACGAAAVAYVLLRGLLKKKLNLQGKVVLITGASSGIGEALAREFVKAGSRVILAARSIEKLRNLRQELLESYNVPESNVRASFLDLEDHAGIPSVSKQLIEEFGRIDILINNAGVSMRDPVLKMDMKAYKKTLDINFFGQVAVTKEILPSMIENGGGTIVAVSSLQGRFALPGGSAYGASKFALQAFCDSLRAETTKKNIHVLVVSPSYVKTNIALAGYRGDGTNPGEQRKEIEKGMSVEYCAQTIVESIVNYEPELVIGPIHHRLLIYIRTLFPKVYMYIMSRL